MLPGRGTLLLPKLGLLVLLGAAGCGDEGDAPAPGTDAGSSPEASGSDAGFTDSIDEDDASGTGPAPADAPAAYPRPQYQRLSETGLFADLAGRTVDPVNRLFRPIHQLWSDSAEKRRWLRLPPGAQIDSADMDAWQFPVGTKVWKEFARGGAALETRLIERFGPGPEDYWMGSFVWAPDGSDAIFSEPGVNDINGTTHDAPPAKSCLTCHRGEKSRLLGLSAIQLSHDETSEGGLTLGRLASEGILSHPPAANDYRVPGDELTAAALGYLHANCGHCHNRNGAAWPDTQAVMRLGFGERDAATTATFRSLVGQRFTYWRHPTLKLLVAPGDGEASAVLARMKIRGSKDQMPPLATELVDPAAVDLLARWITSLPVPPPALSDAGAAD